MNTEYGGGRLRVVREKVPIEPTGESIVTPESREHPTAQSVKGEGLLASCAARVSWNLKVNARDVFTLCRILHTCDEIDIKRCTPVVKQGEARIRVDVTLPEDRIDNALHHVMLHVNSAEFGRIEK